MELLHGFGQGSEGLGVSGLRQYDSIKNHSDFAQPA